MQVPSKNVLYHGREEPDAFRDEPGQLIAAPADEVWLSLRPYAYVRIDPAE